MIIRITVNKETLEWTSDDPEVSVNKLVDTGEFLEIEVSKPDPQLDTLK